MVEASPVKFYMAKYSFLFIAVLQWMIGGALFYLYGLVFINVLIATSLVLLGIILVMLFIVVRDKIKRVAIGSNKFVILEDNSNIRFGWAEIKSLRLIPFLDLCKVKIKGKKGSFYFFTAGDVRNAIERFSPVQTKVK